MLLLVKFFVTCSVHECHGRRQEATKEETSLLTWLVYVFVKMYDTYKHSNYMNLYTLKTDFFLFFST